MKKAAIKILLVDDEPDILEIVGYNLKNEGYQIATASNGVEAIQVAKKNLTSSYFVRCYDARNGWYRGLRKIAWH